MLNVRKMRKLIITGLFGVAVGKYLNNHFELTSGAAAFLETLFNYNDFEGLAFFILTTAVSLFIMFKLYKLLTVKTDIE